jgi:hypothetical protein
MTQLPEWLQQLGANTVRTDGQGMFGNRFDTPEYSYFSSYLPQGQNGIGGEEYWSQSNQIDPNSWMRIRRDLIEQATGAGDKRSVLNGNLMEYLNGQDGSVRGSARMENILDKGADDRGQAMTAAALLATVLSAGAAGGLFGGAAAGGGGAAGGVSGLGVCLASVMPG